MRGTYTLRGVINEPGSCANALIVRRQNLISGGSIWRQITASSFIEEVYGFLAQERYGTKLHRLDWWMWMSNHQNCAIGWVTAQSYNYTIIHGLRPMKEFHLPPF